MFFTMLLRAISHIVQLLALHVVLRPNFAHCLISMTDSQNKAQSHPTLSVFKRTPTLWVLQCSSAGGCYSLEMVFALMTYSFPSGDDN